MKEITMEKSQICVTGVTVTKEGLHVCAALRGREKNGMILTDVRTGKKQEIDFPASLRRGSVYQVLLRDFDVHGYTYLFHEDGKALFDKDAKALRGHRLFGEAHRESDEDALSQCVFLTDEFDWKEDVKPATSFSDSIFYSLHVRGFTQDSSSRIKEAGTFLGLSKKVSYLKKLGITGVILQPIYEFEECEKSAVNYWGYKPGYYYAPKNAYASTEDAVTECKEMVRTLHKEGIQVFLQFFFDKNMSSYDIRSILAFWTQEYHIDGFQLLGEQIPYKELANDPFLSDVKLLGSGMPWDDLFPYDGDMQGRAAKKELPERRLAGCDRSYMYNVRRFLKGDDSMLSDFLREQRENPAEHGSVKCLADFEGFRLADLVSYDAKHNEANGEDNRDGSSYNCSWNCGVEGPTRKKSILALRMRQMKNAMAILMTAQGAPMIFMGDEWGKSSLGNNNPYCQDNELTWQKWNLKKPEKEFLDFTCQMIAFRKAHGIFHQEKPLSMMDYKSCGFPDLSYHGKEAWRPETGSHIRHIAALFSGSYDDRMPNDDDFYVVYNMHWEDHEFALPKLKKGKKWQLLISTTSQDEGEEINVTDITVTSPSRSVQIYRSCKE